MQNFPVKTATTNHHISPAPPPQHRLDAVKFLIKCAEQLQLSATVKFSALSLFSHRFIPSLSTSHNHRHHWLLKKPLNYPQFQLFSLISLWISSKTYDSPPLQLKTLKLIGDQYINDQHFTKSDYLDAEILFLQTVNFDIGTMKNSALFVVEDLLMKLKEVAKVAETLSFEACCDVLDLMFEKDEVSRILVDAPVFVATAVVVAVYAMTVPKPRFEFPVVGWVSFVTGCREDDVISVVKLVLSHVIPFN